MREIVTGKEMASLDENTSGYYKVPPIVLMEQAANAFVSHFVTSFDNIKNPLVLVGNGNNGGDGIAIARLLNQRGIKTYICQVDETARASESFLKQLEIYKAYNYPVLNRLNDYLEYDYIIDAVFGTGLKRNLEGLYKEAIELVNSMKATKIACDIPSGISADSGELLGCAFKADYTYTFSFEKLGLLLWPGSDYAGEVKVLDMGITRESFLGKPAKIYALDESDLKQMIPMREDHSNKGTYGKLLIIAGSKDMAGAAYLAAKAAYRTGCGLVKIYTHEDNRQSIFSLVPEAILKTYSKTINESELIEELKWADAVVIGPGLSKSDTAKKILNTALKNVTVPMLIDADAINIIAENVSILQRPHLDLILTPHMGEMARLTGTNVEYIQKDIVDQARDFASNYDIILALKDFRTITAIPYGRTYINLSGNNGMATAGSGDVLSGIIGGLLAMGINAKDAAVCGVFIHGLAGDKAAESANKASMMASDIIEGLSQI